MPVFAARYRLTAILMLLFALHAAASHAADHSAPQPPRLREPKDNAVLRNHPRTVSFEWKDVSDRSGVSYYIQIDAFHARPDGGGRWTSQTFGPLRDNQYTYTHPGDLEGRWSVWAVDGAGNIGKRSDVRKFVFYTGAASEESMYDRPEETPAPAATPRLTPEPVAAIEPVRPPALSTPEPVADGSYWSSAAPQLTAATSLSQDLTGIPVTPAVGSSEDMTPPPAVSPKSPGDGEGIYAYPPQVTLEWSPCSEPGVTYTAEVQIEYPFEGGGSAPRSQFYRNLSGTSVTHKHPGDYPAKWRVWAVDAAGNAGAPSGWRRLTFETNGSSKRASDITSVLGIVESTPDAPVPAGLTQEVALVNNAGAAGIAAPAVTPRAAEVAAPGEEEAIPAPVQTSPRDGAIVDDDENYVICKWQGPDSARYNLEKQTYDPATGQWNSEFYKNLTSSSKTADHTAPLRGRWRVQATIRGTEGPWSPWRYFSYHGEGANTDAPESTSRPLPYAQVASEADTLAPDSPLLRSPTNQSVVNAASRRVELEWSAVQDPSGVSYTCVIETASADGQWQAHAFPGLAEAHLSYQSPGPGKARWWVIAIDAAGNQSKPSKVHEITFEPTQTASAPAGAAPQPLAPTTGASVAPGNIELSWSAIDPAVRIEVQVIEPRTVGGGQWKSAVAQDVQGNKLAIQVAANYEVRWRAGSPGGWCAWQYFQTGK